MMGFSLIIIQKWWIKWLLLSSPLSSTADSDFSMSETESEEEEMNDFEDQEELKELDDSITLDEYQHGLQKKTLFWKVPQVQMASHKKERVE